jgi:hypothetical protein
MQTGTLMLPSTSSTPSKMTFLIFIAVDVVIVEGDAFDVVVVGFLTRSG